MSAASRGVENEPIVWYNRGLHLSFNALSGRRYSMNPLTILLQVDDEVVQQASPIARLIDQFGSIIFIVAIAVLLIVLAIFLVPRLFASTQRCSVPNCGEKADSRAFHGGRASDPATLCNFHARMNIKDNSPAPAPKEA